MKKLEIGVESAIWYDDERPEESIRFIKECGFETVDYDFHHLFKATFDRDKLTSFYDKSLEELFEYFKPLKVATEKNGITLTQTHGIMWTHSYQREDISDYLIKMAEKTIALCEYLGCKNLVVHPWHGPEVRKDEEREINLNTYSRLIPAGI